MKENKPLRTKRSLSEIKALLKEQASSNTRVNEFCKTRQISRALFYHWRSKHGNLKAQPAFVPVQLSSDEPAQAIFAEIAFPQQLSIRLFRHVDPAYIKALIKP
jgi:hypothetical protein